jgi:acetyl-CoA C-acetyltransferase
LGCVTPIGDQGGDIAKTAAIAAGWNDDVAGVQINRFCASGLEAVNMAAMKVRSGWEDLWLLVALNQCHVFQWVLMVDHGH